MAQYNTGNSAFQAGNKTLFEVNQIATIDGGPVTTNNRFPVDIGNASISISGNVNINTPNTVTVNSTPEDPVHIHITEVGNSGILAVPYLPIGGNVVVTSGNVAVTGSVNVGNFPASQNVVVSSGNVNAIVSGNVNSFVYNANGTAVSNVAPLPVTISGPNGGTNVVTADLGAAARSAFGELLTVSPTPIVQLDALRGVDAADMTTLASGTGASAGTDAAKLVFKVQNGTSSNGKAHLLSKKYMKYRPGQGSLSRFTAAFTTGVANSTQRAGLTDSEVALCVGYDGVDFGVVRATGGKVPIRKLTITVAPTGTQTGVVTLNGVAKNVTITAGTTTNCAAQIAIDGVGGYPGWYTEQVDNTVIFRAIDPFVTTGAFSFSSTGAGTLAVGTFATIQTGVAQTEYWTKQADFNMDTLDGSGDANNPSGMNLDTTKLNVYQISFRWLGVGVINYAIEDQVTGEIIMFHQQHYTNQHLLPHIDNPSFRIGYTVTNKGNTTNLTVIGSSMMMAIEGVLNLSRASKSAAVNKTSLAKDDLHHVLSLRNSYTFADKINTASINLKGLSFGVQATDPVTIYVFQDPTTQSVPLVFSDVINSITTRSSTTATFDIASELPIAVYVVGINGYDNLDVSHLLISEPAGSILTFAATSPGAISRITVAAMWSED